MKEKILVNLLAIALIVVGFIGGIVVTLKAIEIDGVNEVDNGVITIKVFNQYIDYQYQYTEIKK